MIAKAVHRVGQKGRTEHRGGLGDRRCESTYILDAVRPATGDGIALILPMASTKAMQIFLDEFVARLAADTQAVLGSVVQAGMLPAILWS
ncbi:transposase (plasmid) [Rhodovastum atsumiense]|uniref:hypothetical protein n=1 Tax=Rhodovastum atsumiense TaxID=504468 RepID=UPI002025B3DA|nr:hypothetical protein [Rhodovastum atsumiense]CAH2605424.1 transposase [Rhodovastum atsumiense]